MGEYNREDLPLWVKVWLESKGDKVHVFVTMKKDGAPYLADANESGRKAFKEWTGAELPVMEKVPHHIKADNEAWDAYEAGDLDKLSKLIGYEEEMGGKKYVTIKTPISEKYIVIATREKD